jgi:hypothetical protein
MTDWRSRVEAFESGACGDSVRNVRLRGLELARAHEVLVGAGFRCRRSPIGAPQTKPGERRWRTTLAATTRLDDPQIVYEHLYDHADGGLVRLYPSQAPMAAFRELGEPPFARKSLLRAEPEGSFGFEDEVCIVSDRGAALPRSPRPSDGLKFEFRDVLGSFRLARTVLREQFIPLARGDKPLPTAPPTPGCALTCGFTVVPRGDFWKTARSLRARAAGWDPAVLVREEQGNVVLFFSGSSSVRRDVLGQDFRPALASLCIHGGAYVVSVEPFGYEASVEHLRDFFTRVFPELGECAVYDNLTGADVTKIAERLPANLFNVEGPGYVEIEEP